jgi:alkylhydroperoxidase family enzyme
MRIPYVPDPPPTSTAEEAAIVSRVQARRAPRPLQPLDLALLHSPPIADGWNSFLGAVRTQTSLPAGLREIAISRVAVCNRAWYEWKHHAPLAVQGGVSKEAMELIKDEGELQLQRPKEAEDAGLDEKLWAAVVYTDEMTRRVQVRDEVFEVIKKHFSEQEIVELTTTVSLNMAPC